MADRAYERREGSREDRAHAAAEPRRPPRAGDLSPAALLALQGTAGNRAVTATLSRWRDFNAARGLRQHDYKIVQGTHATAGNYHLKFHNVDRLDAFDEIHVVFEDKDPMAYFFFTDAGELIPGRSNTGLMHPDLEPVARELVTEQLATSEVVPTEKVEAARKAKSEQQAKDKAFGEQRKQEDEAKWQQHEAQQAEAREASKASADEGLHIDNFMRDVDTPSGERPAFVAYLEGTAAARPYWKAKADWYKLQRDSGWKVTLEEKRYSKKAKNKPTADSVRTEHNLPASATVALKETRSGPNAVKITPEITFPNYTTYAASKIGEKPPK
jgi:hypothetical protein